MSKFSIIFSSIIAIIMGLLQLFGIDVYLGKAGTVEASVANGIFFICFGLFALFVSKFIKETKQKFSKCPNCKEVFDYSNLKNGKCPTCNIDTIDIEEYFKIYPDELEDKEK